MRKTSLSLCLIVSCFAAAAFAASPKPQPFPPMTPDKWRADIDYFARELPKRHMNAFHEMKKEDFERQVADLRASVGKTNDEQIIVGLMQIASQIGDGHTHVAPPSTFHRLPISVAFYADEVRVTRATDKAKALLGGRLATINDKPIGEVLRRVASVISRGETEAFVKGAAPSVMLCTEILYGLKVTDAPAHARLAIIGPDGADIAVEVDGVPAATSPADWLNASSVPPPLSRQNPDDAFFVKSLDEQKAVYVNFRRYDDLDAHSRELWKLVDSKKPEKLIIDLRQNGGGDYTKGRKYLVSELTKRPRMRTFVLIGNRTFSAAMVNAIDFRNMHATLVGEPIGERPNSYQENDEMVLPNSKIVVSYSTRFYKFLEDEGSEIVRPDKEVKMQWSDYVNGRDAALDWALR
jgi:hypothetical protein